MRSMLVRMPQNRAPSRFVVLKETTFETAAEESARAKWFYSGYIISFALVDLTALLRLIPDIAVWVHLLITLLLSVSAVACITTYVRINTRVNHYQTEMLRHLMRAHNEQAAELKILRM